jgi:AcrR family transcriptional regulator
MAFSEEPSLGTEDVHGRPGLRERKKAKLRQRIIETSLELFKERGYNETRVADIVEALEISQPTFFRYFPSKDAVLKEMLQLNALIGREQIERAMHPRETSSRRSFEEIMRIGTARLCRWCYENKTLTRAFAVSGAAVPWVNPQALGAAADHSPVQLFQERAIELAQRAGELSKERSCEQLAQILVGMMGHIVFEWASHEEPPYDLAERLDGALAVFLGGARGA